MPRPGPRPYECVRRAWHSDRHNPMRGSIIRQIFRLATEAHSSATKKNKEWQEKLPIVVFRAEQIMYSKANSEAEYMNLESLWDRVNDAVDTIIRRDQSTETGDLLPPCVEAALNLGCIPVRASRSQRHSNPRTYLSPRTQEPASAASRVVNTSAEQHCPQFSPVHSGNKLNFAGGAASVNLTVPVSQSNCHVTKNNNPAAPHSYPIMYENSSSGHNQMSRLETKMPSNLGSVFPLYYGAHHQTTESHSAHQASENTDCNIVFVGTPVCTSIAKHAEMGALRTIFSSPGDDLACNRVEQQAELRGSHASKKPFGSECDLSLQLGLFSDACRRLEEGNNPGTQCTDGSTSQEGFKVNDAFQQKNTEFCFFPEKNIDVPSEFGSRKSPLEGDIHYAADNMRKRKALFGDNLEDAQFCWQYESEFNPFSH